MRKCYVEAGWKERGQSLDEMQAVTAVHRKALIRLMNGPLVGEPRVEQPGNSYGPEVDDPLRVTPESLGYVCGERLTPNLARTAQHRATHGEIETTPELLQDLRRINVSTVRRRLEAVVVGIPPGTRQYHCQR